MEVCCNCNLCVDRRFFANHSGICSPYKSPSNPKFGPKSTPARSLVKYPQPAGSFPVESSQPAGSFPVKSPQPAGSFPVESPQPARNPVKYPQPVGKFPVESSEPIRSPVKYTQSVEPSELVRIKDWVEEDCSPPEKKPVPLRPQPVKNKCKKCDGSYKNGCRKCGKSYENIMKQHKLYCREYTETRLFLI